MSTRRQRRAGLARERAAGTRRKPCPWCGRLLLMTASKQAVKHEEPACEKFGEAVLKAAEQTKAVAGDAGGFEVGADAKGVEHVETTFAEPGPVQVHGCPEHGMGCPPTCPMLKLAEEYVANPPPPCRPGDAT